MESIVQKDHQYAHFAHQENRLQLGQPHLMIAHRAILVRTVFAAARIIVLKVSLALVMEMMFVRHVRMEGQLRVLDAFTVMSIAETV